MGLQSPPRHQNGSALPGTYDDGWNIRDGCEMDEQARLFESNEVLSRLLDEEADDDQAEMAVCAAASAVVDEAMDISLYSV